MTSKRTEQGSSRWFVILAIAAQGALAGCLEPPDALKKGKATLSGAQRIVARNSAVDNTNSAARPDLTGPGVIALGLELAADLKIDLLAQGLTLQQASAIADKAYIEVRASVIAINVDSGFALVDGEAAKSPLQIASPLIVKGATKSLDDDDVGLPREQRSDTLAGVVGSSFKSMNGRTAGLESADMLQLSTSLVSVAVQSLPEAGMGEADAGVASQSITRGAVAALGVSGIASTAVGDVVSAVVAGTVSGFASLNIGSEAVRAVAAQATAGAIASLDQTGLSVADSVVVMGEVANSSITALQSYAQGALLMSAVASDVAASAIQALQGSEILTSGRFAEAVKNIAQGAVEGLKNTGLATTDLAQGASAVAAGAIKGIATTASNDQLKTEGLAEAALSGTFSAMATASNLSDSAKTELMATVVEKAVQSLAETSSVEAKKALLGEVVSAAVSGMKTLGVSEVSTVQTTLQSVSEKATQSLVAAGFSAADLSAATQVLTSATVTSLDEVGLTNISATQLQAMVTVVVTGVSSGLDQLSNSGQIDASVKEATLNTSATTAAQAVSTLQVTQQLSSAEQTALQQGTKTSLATIVKPVIRYHSNPYSLYIGQLVTITPTIEVAVPTSCRATPNLPAGLSLRNDCVITGTPTTIMAVSNFQITPANDKGDGDTQTLTLTILGPEAPPTVVPQITFSSTTYFINGSENVSIVPTQTQGAVSYCQIDQQLPPGLWVDSTCGIFGAVDFYSDSPYEPSNCKIQDLNGNIIAQNCSTEPLISAFRYLLSFTVTPFNYQGISGEPSQINLAISRPPTIYPHLQYQFQINASLDVSITPRSGTVLAGDHCTLIDVTPSNSATGTLPTGLSFNTSTCALTGTVTTPIATRRYQVTLRRGQSDIISNFTLSVRMQMPITMQVAKSSGYHSLTWNPLSLGNLGANTTIEYLVMASYSPVDTSVSSYPSSMTLVNIGDWLSPWGQVIGLRQNPSMYHDEIFVGADYYYTVFARLNSTDPWLHGAYIGKGTSGPYRADASFAGLEDLYLVSPRSSNTIQPQLAAVWQPFFPDNIASVSFNLYGGSDPSPSPLTQLNSELIYYPSGPFLFNNAQTGTNYRVSVSPVFNGAVAPGPFPERNVNLASGSHHKIFGRNRYFSTPVSQLRMARPTVASADRYGNMLFAPGDGTIQVLCQNSAAIYCYNRMPNTVSTLIGRDGEATSLPPTPARTGYQWPSNLLLGKITALAVDRLNNVYFYDATYKQILAYCLVTSPAGGVCANKDPNKLVWVAGNQAQGTPLVDAQAQSSPLGLDLSLVIDQDDNIIFAQAGAAALYAICYKAKGPYCGAAFTGQIVQIAGTGTQYDGASGVSAESASFGTPRSLAIDFAKAIYFIDQAYNRVRVLCTQNTLYYLNHICYGKAAMSIHNLAGDGSSVMTDTSSGNLALNAALGKPSVLALDYEANVLVFDKYFKKMRLICQKSYMNTSGICATKAVGHLYHLAFVGSGDSSGPVPLLDAAVGDIVGLALDSNGNFLALDASMRRLRAGCLSPQGLCYERESEKVYPLNGAEQRMDLGDDSNAINESLYGKGISAVVDADGNLVVADPAVRRIYLQCLNPNSTPCLNQPVGQRLLLAGSGGQGVFQGDGTPLADANLPQISSIAVDANGNVAVVGQALDNVGSGKVYLLCRNNQGANCDSRSAGRAYVLAGDGSNIYASNLATGVGPLATSIGQPRSLTFDNSGNLFIAAGAQIYLNCVDEAGGCTGRTAGYLYAIAGNRQTGDAVNAVQALQSPLGLISQMVVFSGGNLLLGDQSSHRLRLLCLNLTGVCIGKTVGALYRWAGDPTATNSASDNIAKEAIKLLSPSGLALNQWQDVLVQTATNPRIWLICNQNISGPCNGKSAGYAYHLAGTGQPGNGASNLPATATALGPVATDTETLQHERNRLAVYPPTGDVFVADGELGTIRLFLGLAGATASGSGGYN